jgi:phytoene/squalene synthetase
MPDHPTSLPSAPEAFSALLPPRAVEPAKRAALAALADFMALARSIADDPELAPHLKTARLGQLEKALHHDEGYQALPHGVPPSIMMTAFKLRRESDRLKIPAVYGRRIVQAYKQDFAKKHYRDWSELLVYLRFSAGSSAQFSQEALGLDKKLSPALDALAYANVLLARLASVRDDFIRSKRLYLPLKWLESAGLDAEELSLDSDASKWTQVRDRGIAQVRQLLTQSIPCVAGAPNWRLRRAFAWISAGIEVRSDALAAAPFPAASAPAPTAVRLAYAYVRTLLARPPVSPAPKRS